MSTPILNCSAQRAFCCLKLFAFFDAERLIKFTGNIMVSIENVLTELFNYNEIMLNLLGKNRWKLL